MSKKIISIILILLIVVALVGFITYLTNGTISSDVDSFDSMYLLVDDEYVNEDIEQSI